jgi:hypothetical protein
VTDATAAATLPPMNATGFKVGWGVWCTAVLMVLVGTAPLRADDADASAPVVPLLNIGEASLRPVVERRGLGTQPEGEPAGSATNAPPVHKEYGREGSSWLTVGGGAAPNLTNATDYNLHVGYSVFLVDKFEVGGEVGAWYFDQPGPNAEGLSLHLTMRWHFIMTHNWSVFLDAGIGVMGATDDVPSGGTGFDFMPRAGVGFTRRLTDDVRLEMGIRWHHISNARIHGESRNPSRDAAMFYAGLIFPF